MNDTSYTPTATEADGGLDDPLDDEPRGRLLRLTIVALVLLIAGLAILLTTYDLHRIRTATMLPTLPVSGLGVYLPVDEADDIEPGDIVRFRSDWPDAQGFPELTFRVLAVGGDRVAGERGGKITINGSVLDEPYIDTINSAVQPQFEIVVPDGRLFVAGDARSMSFDSRLRLDDEHEGTIAADSVSGRLVGVAWPVWQWSIPDSDRGTPWPFVVASLLILGGGLLGFICLVRVSAAGVASARQARARRRLAPSRN